MSAAYPSGTVVVTDDHMVVPSFVVDPVVVTFDGLYVWSFVARRDGGRTRGGWRVPWPDALRPRLEGSAHVRLADTTGDRVLFEGPVSFGGGTAPLVLQDAHGHPLAVDKTGHLIRVFSETGADVRRHIAHGTARAIADLRDKVGIDAHISYGCLLGAVRDGRLISHDSDSDIAYLSAQTHPADVVRESFRMEREMRLLGWRVVRMSGADLKLLLPLPDGRTCDVDVFGGFHVEDTFYLMGGRSGQVARESLTPATTVSLEGVELAAPADPETVLEFLYGSSWRVPDPSFQAVDPWPGLRRIEGWMRGTRTHVAEWNTVYREQQSSIPRQGSSFARWSHERMPVSARVADVGSGSGRDSAWLTRQDHQVVALDYSGEARRHSRRRLTRAGAEPPDARVILFNDLRSVLLAGAELAREPEPPYLYARGLVSCLDADARRNLWLLCRMSLRRGGSLFLEYPARPSGVRTPASVAPDGLGRRVSTRRLVREIAAAGGRVVRREAGPGLDFHDLADPHVARLEVCWTQPNSPVDPSIESARPPMEQETAMRRKLSLTARKDLYRKAAAIPEWVRDLTSAVHENRRLNRRVAELTDVVAELLIPLADRDEARARELLESYRRTTLAP